MHWIRLVGTLMVICGWGSSVFGIKRDLATSLKATARVVVTQAGALGDEVVAAVVGKVGVQDATVKLEATPKYEIRFPPVTVVTDSPGREGEVLQQQVVGMKAELAAQSAAIGALETSLGKVRAELNRSLLTRPSTQLAIGLGFVGAVLASFG